MKKERMLMILIMLSFSFMGHSMDDDFEGVCPPRKKSKVNLTDEQLIDLYFPLANRGNEDLKETLRERGLLDLFEMNPLLLRKKYFEARAISTNDLVIDDLNWAVLYLVSKMGVEKLWTSSARALGGEVGDAFCQRSPEISEDSEDDEGGFL